MRLNIKIIIALSILVGCACGSAYAQAAYAGPFGFGIELKGTGANASNSGITTLYAFDNGGTTRLLPSGSLAALDQTSWANGSAASPALKLGAFNPGAGDTLTLFGGSMLTYQGGGATVTASHFNYAIGGFVPGIRLLLDETNINGTVGDTRWSCESAGVNLLAGLTNGTYVLQCYGCAGSSVGNLYENNGGGNFKATFTVISTPRLADLRPDYSGTNLATAIISAAANGITATNGFSQAAILPNGSSEPYKSASSEHGSSPVN